MMEVCFCRIMFDEVASTLKDLIKSLSYSFIVAIELGNENSCIDSMESYLLKRDNKAEIETVQSVCISIMNIDCFLK